MLPSVTPFPFGPPPRGMKPKIPFGDSWYVEGSWDLRVYYYLQHPPVTIATRRPKGEVSLVGDGNR